MNGFKGREASVEDDGFLEAVQAHQDAFEESLAGLLG